MPRPIIARLSHSHRLACFSLYRALLRSSCALSPLQSGGLKLLIRRRFKTDRSLQSPSQIANGLDAGHQFLDLLRSSVRGETRSTATLVALLESTLKVSDSQRSFRDALRAARLPVAPPQARKADRLCINADKPLHSRPPDTRPVLDRPLPLSEIKSAKRRVPKFVVAQGFPFLRYSKPQPSTLGRVLKQKAVRQSKRWDQRDRLVEQTIPLCQSEDTWDAIVADRGKQENSSNQLSTTGDDLHHLSENSESWSSDAHDAEAGIAHKMRVSDQKTLETGRRMVEIIKQERALAVQEKAELEKRKYDQRMLRRANEGAQMHTVK